MFVHAIAMPNLLILLTVHYNTFTFKCYYRWEEVDNEIKTNTVFLQILFFTRIIPSEALVNLYRRCIF